MDLRNVVLFGIISVFSIEAKTNAAEALARLSCSRAPSAIHLRLHTSVPQIIRLREQSPRSVQSVRHQPLYLLPQRTTTVFPIDHAVSSIKHSNLRFQPLMRFYSTATDLKFGWNKGHVPSRTPTQSKSLVDDLHEDASNRVWHFDPKRSLPYYLEEIAAEHQNTEVKQPVKQDEDMVAYSLKKKTQ